jgi:hypothetical protein
MSEADLFQEGSTWYGSDGERRPELTMTRVSSKRRELDQTVIDMCVCVIMSIRPNMAQPDLGPNLSSRPKILSRLSPTAQPKLQRL